MYEAYLNGELLYFPADEENALISPKLELELNSPGAFEFEMPPGNPVYEKIEPRRSMVQILKDGKEIFQGEVREVEKDFYKVKRVSVTGELAFLFDSIQPQAEFHDLTTRQLLETWLNEHNSQVEDRKKFYVGIVSIHDSNDSLYRYTNRETTLGAIQEKLVGRLGGYLRIRKDGGKRYLDWITQPEYGKYCKQPIEFGTNLLDYSETVSAEDLATAVIPLGARLDDNYGHITSVVPPFKAPVGYADTDLADGNSPIKALDSYTDITSVNGGKDYLYIPEAVERYGWVKKVMSWDDVTIPSNLKEKGQKWLQDNQYENMTLELTALDLSDLGEEYDAFELGDMVHATAWPLGMDRDFPIRKMTIYLQETESNKLELGTTEKKTFSNQVANSNLHFSTELDNTRQTTAWLQSAIDNATAMMTGSKGGYKVTEFDGDGRWLRDLYMNAPSKEQATRLMQINMNGIGFSRDGFKGPYKNAWTIDGVLLGEFIKAGTIDSEKLSAEYKDGVTRQITAQFKVAEGLIAAKVSKGDVSSQLSLEPELINISGPRLKIDTEKFKVDYDGTLRILDAYIEISSSQSQVSMTDGMIYFADVANNSPVGKMAFNPESKMFCMGSYGSYSSFGLGYWSEDAAFYPLIQINRLSEQGIPSVEFKDIGTMSVNGRNALSGDIWYVSDMWYNEDGSIHKEMGSFTVKAGLIMS